MNFTAHQHKKVRMRQKRFKSITDFVCKFYVDVFSFGASSVKIFMVVYFLFILSTVL